VIIHICRRKEVLAGTSENGGTGMFLVTAMNRRNDDIWENQLALSGEQEKRSIE
jgi:hypothetical protein